MPTDGIDQLINVTQMKSGNSNGEALDGADQQRDLLKRQRRLRAADASIDEAGGDAMARAGAEMKKGHQDVNIPATRSPLAEIGHDPLFNGLSDEPAADGDDDDASR